MTASTPGEALTGYIRFLLAHRVDALAVAHPHAEACLEALLAGHSAEGPGEAELLAFVPDYTADVRVAMAIVHELRARFGSVAEELRRHNGFLAELVAALPGSVSFIDADERIMLINREGAERLGATPEALVGRTMLEVLGPNYEQVAGPMRRVSASGEAIREVESRIEIHGRDPVYRDFALVPLHGPDGEMEGVLSASFDVTERVLAGQRTQAYIAQLELLDRLKTDFLGMVSHELRTPINAVLGYASILDDQVSGPLNEEQHTFIGRIMRGADTLLTLIEDLLDMSRIQAGKFTVRCKPVDARQVVREVATALEPLAKKRGQTFELELPDDPGPLQADPQRLAQVLTNLMANAVKFGPPGDHVRVKVAAEQDAVRFAVEDHGPGIQAADLSKLFVPFTRLDVGNTRRSSGAGLGLSIVKAIAESHGGEVGVASEPGVCTVFSVRLPRDGVRRGA